MNVNVYYEFFCTFISGLRTRMCSVDSCWWTNRKCMHAEPDREQPKKPKNAEVRPRSIINTLYKEYYI